MINLDLPALRTFVAAVDLGGFGKAAHAVHRTPGAVSLQLKALEERLGEALFVREGKKQRLTPAGETLLAYARRLLDTNDEALLALQSMRADGHVRLGMPQDLADSWLPAALARVSRAHPAVRVQLQVGRSADLRQALQAAELDMVIAFGPDGCTSPDCVARLEVRWWAHHDLSLASDRSVPLLLLKPPCLFRDAAIAALEQAGRPWHIALVSDSVSAIWAAAAAGLGVAARAPLHVPNNVALLKPADELPPLAPIGLYLHRAEATQHPALDYLDQLVRETYGDVPPSGA